MNVADRIGRSKRCCHGEAPSSRSGNSQVAACPPARAVPGRQDVGKRCHGRVSRKGSPSPTLQSPETSPKLTQKLNRLTTNFDSGLACVGEHLMCSLDQCWL